MKEKHVQLSEVDRQYLEGLVKKGTQQARVFKRATGLLELDRSKTLGAVAESLGVSRATVANWRDSYSQRGLQCLVLQL
jgi:transposase